PFLMLDEFRSDDPAAYIAGFPDHPHRGFETVTYMLAGRLRHRDNKGHEELTAEEIPTVPLGPGVEAKLIAGRLADARGPVEPGATEPLLADLHLAPDAAVTLALAPQHNAFAYVYEGSAAVGTPPTELVRGTVAVLSTGDDIAIAAGGEGARLLLVAGQPLREPVAKYGPFVMNSEAELRQAVLDYQAGRF